MGPQKYSQFKNLVPLVEPREYKAKIEQDLNMAMVSVMTPRLKYRGTIVVMSSPVLTVTRWYRDCNKRSSRVTLGKIQKNLVVVKKPQRGNATSPITIVNREKK